jgi:hypothetical protein
MLDFNSLPAQDKLYYLDAESGIAIYCADNRDILPKFDSGIYMTITDPPWPNCNQTGSETIFPEVAKVLSVISPRLAVILGCDSDPRWLKCIPESMIFFVDCWLSRNPPTPKGYKWYSGEVVYIFGEGFRNDKRTTLMSSQLSYVSSGRRKNNHPAPRNEMSMRRFLGSYSKTDDIILDPFLGSGTISAVAKEINRKCIGIEINPDYCDMAVKRLQQSVMSLGIAKRQENTQAPIKGMEN